MKKNLLFIFLFSPIALFSQQAFYETRTIIDYEELLLREDLNELMEVYIEKMDFGTVQKEQTEQVVQFMNDPFNDSFDYASFSTEGFIVLDQLVEENANIKKEIRERDYDLLLECDSLLPEEYEVFLKEDKIVFDELLYECFEKKYYARYPISYEVEPEPVTAQGPPAVYSEDVPSSIAIPVPPVVSFPTKVIDATSQFLVERVKEELLLAFFDRFFQQIDNSTELTSLMPNTYFLLKNNDIFKVPSMGEVWVTAFEEDLSSLLVNFENMVLTHPDYLQIKGAPKLQYFLMSSFIYQQIKDDVDLTTQMNSFYEKFSNSNLEVVKMLGVVNLLSKNLKEQYAVDQWISGASFQNLLYKEENAASYFSGLLYQQDRELFNGIVVKTSEGEEVYTDQIKTNIRSFTEKTGKFLATINQFQVSNSSLKKAKTMKIESIEEFQNAALDHALAIFDLLDYGIELAYFKNPDQLYTSSYFTTYRPLAIKAIQTYDAALREDLGQLVLHSMQMMEPLVQVRIDHLQKKITTHHNNISTDPNLKEKIKRVEKEIKILESVVKNYVYYGGFMVDILTAETTQDIKYIIFKYAEPAGSFRVKRQSDFSVSLSSYPGLHFGLESTHTAKNSTSFVTGITAPIGLSLNWGRKTLRASKRHHSLSLYVPIIDIGAAFSYRWKNSEGEGFPDNIKWEQVLSPGMHWVWGIGNSPMALMVGAQYTPLLRNITDENNVLQPNAWRFGATITVDIPFFHFYNMKR